jgi:hypothetical protein
MSALPNYLPRADQEFFPTPYTMERAQMLALVMKAPSASVLAQNFIDPTLNAAAGSPGRFVPEFGGHFVLGHIFYPTLKHSGADFGSFAYTESVIYLPVRDTEPFSYWFTPVMLLDSFLPLIAGREIYGITKALGRFSATPQPLSNLFSGPSPQAHVTVEAQGFATKSKAEVCDWQRLWSLKINSESGSLLENTPGHAADELLSSHLPRPFNLVDDVWSALLGLIGSLNPGIFLKQFPSVQGTALADYRRLVRAAYKPTALHRIRLLSGGATFFSPASFPVADLLGLTPGSVVPAELGLIVEMDWTVPTGEELPGQPAGAPACRSSTFWERLCGLFG